MVLDRLHRRTSGVAGAGVELIVQDAIRVVVPVGVQAADGIAFNPDDEQMH